MRPETNSEETSLASTSDNEVEGMVKKAISEFRRHASEEEDAALKGKLREERRRREELERRLNEMRQENRRTRQQAEEAERHSQIQDALREFGVQKTNLAFRLVKDEIFRTEEGDLYADSEGERMPYREYLKRFVLENPEFLPPRIAGGSGATGVERREFSRSGFDLERIRPGMSAEELAQAWKEVARLAGEGSGD
jgi:hypothetical protein